MLYVGIFIIGLLVFYGFTIFGQNAPDIKPPKQSFAPPVVMVDTNNLVQARQETALEAKKTADVRYQAWRSVITEYKATKDSLRALKLADSLPEIMASVGN